MSRVAQGKRWHYRDRDIDNPVYEDIEKSYNRNFDSISSRGYYGPPKYESRHSSLSSQHFPYDRQIPSKIHHIPQPKLPPQRTWLLKKSNTRQRNICLLSIFVIIVVCVIIAPFLYFTFVQKFTRSSLSGNLDSRMVEVEMRVINKEFSSELNDKNSFTYKILKKEIEIILDRFFKNSSLGKDFNQTTIESFSNGSLVVDFRVHLNQAFADNIARNKVETALRESLTNDTKIDDSIVVDPITIKYFVVKMSTVEVSTMLPEDDDDDDNLSKNVDKVSSIKPSSGSSEKTTTIASATNVPSSGGELKWCSWSMWSKCSPELCSSNADQNRTRECCTDMGKGPPSPGLESLCAADGGDSFETRKCVCTESTTRKPTTRRRIGLYTRAPGHNHTSASTVREAVTTKSQTGPSPVSSSQAVSPKGYDSFARWGVWGKWSECSINPCSEDGEQTHTRQCRSVMGGGPPIPDGNKICEADGGSAIETRKCVCDTSVKVQKIGRLTIGKSPSSSENGTFLSNIENFMSDVSIIHITPSLVVDSSIYNSPLLSAKSHFSTSYHHHGPKSTKNSIIGNHRHKSSNKEISITSIIDSTKSLHFSTIPTLVTINEISSNSENILITPSPSLIKDHSSQTSSDVAIKSSEILIAAFISLSTSNDISNSNIQSSFLDTESSISRETPLLSSFSSNTELETTLVNTEPYLIISSSSVDFVPEHSSSIEISNNLDSTTLRIMDSDHLNNLTLITHNETPSSEKNQTSVENSSNSELETPNNNDYGSESHSGSSDSSQPIDDNDTMKSDDYNKDSTLENIVVTEISVSSNLSNTLDYHATQPSRPSPTTLLNTNNNDFPNHPPTEHYSEDVQNDGPIQTDLGIEDGTTESYNSSHVDLIIKDNNINSEEDATITYLNVRVGIPNITQITKSHSRLGVTVGDKLEIDDSSSILDYGNKEDPVQDPCYPMACGDGKYCLPLDSASFECHIIGKPCIECAAMEICLVLIGQQSPSCIIPRNPLDESLCGGWCDVEPQYFCHRLQLGIYQCMHELECLSDEWKCHNGQCIPQYFRCNNIPNCYDKSDEENCSCEYKQQQGCADGSCILPQQYCDNYIDCPDNSDEPKGCDICSKLKFMCNNGRCIDRKMECNGKDDCGDNSEEEHCNRRRPTTFGRKISFPNGQ